MKIPMFTKVDGVSVETWWSMFPLVAMFVGFLFIFTMGLLFIYKMANEPLSPCHDSIQRVYDDRKICDAGAAGVMQVSEKQVFLVCTCPPPTKVPAAPVQVEAP